jgi:hypothetical protein
VKSYLRDYLALQEQAKIQVPEMQMAGLRVLLTKCNFAEYDEEIDSNNKVKVL